MSGKKDEPETIPGSPTGSAPRMGFLSEHIGFQIHIARRALRQHMRQIGVQGDAPPAGTISILTLVSLNPGISQHVIADRLFLDASKVALLVRQLDKAGLVRRERSAEDRRRVQLLLTPAGAERLAQARLFSDKQEKRIGASMSEAERSELLRLLVRLQDSLR